MDKERLISLLDRHARGTCTLEEERELNLWFEKASEKGDWSWSDTEKRQIDVELKESIDRTIQKSVFINRSYRGFLKIAAMLMLISAIAFLFWQHHPSNAKSVIEYAVSKAEAGKRVNLKLSDGTMIILNAGSRLKYPLSFGDNIREVELLEGEAYFDVAHDDTKPFIVISDKTRTQVLGTAFNIRAYRSFEDIKITVTRGKVGVCKTDKNNRSVGAAILLLPNEQLQISRSTGDQKKVHTDGNEILGWTQGKLIFNNERMADVTTLLENTYGVQFKFANETIGRIRFSGFFNSSDSFKEILFSIAKANNLKYIQTGNTITFKLTSINP
ncbi:FecR family protein [Desertivirga brevis]|uniref:FecR family protein n=1 Tax=Desertivirga brevis TaxID=2810310 RepID=UPI001A97321E|nr:FecR domain-containing protein [Pedobacter sp. SYSU D00873]